MVEYTIDDIRGPTVAREMAQLKEFVLAQFNGAIADAEAAAAAAATAAANAILANTVKKTGEASQSIAGDVAITGALDAAAIGSGSTPIVCGDLTAFGSVSLDDTVLQGNLTGADASALINLSGVGSVLVPAPTSNSEAATKKYVDDALDAYAQMVRTTGNQTINGVKKNIGLVWNGVAKVADDLSGDYTITKACTFAMSTGASLRLIVSTGYNNATYQYAELMINARPTPFMMALTTLSDSNAGASASANYGVVDNGDGTFSLYIRKVQRYQAMFIQVLSYSKYGSADTPPDITVNKETVTEFPASAVMAVKAVYKDVA